MAEWVGSRIPHVGSGEAFGPCVAIGVSDSEKIIAGVVYHQYESGIGNVQISMAADSPRWATRATIHALLSVPFLQYGCRRVTTITPHTHKRALRFNRGIGFVSEGTLRRFFDDRTHAVICGLLRRDFDRLFEKG